jgi:hypothetical protein
MMAAGGAQQNNAAAVGGTADAMGVARAGVQASLTIDAAYDTVISSAAKLAGFKMEIVSEMARELKKAPSEIQITSLRSGSTIVGVFIEESDPAKAATLAAHIRSGLLSQQIGRYPVTAADASVVKPTGMAAGADQTTARSAAALAERPHSAACDPAVHGAVAVAAQSCVSVAEAGANSSSSSSSVGLPAEVLFVRASKLLLEVRVGSAWAARGQRLGSAWAARGQRGVLVRLRFVPQSPLVGSALGGSAHDRASG